MTTHSRYWRDKARKLWMSYWRGKPCKVCSRTEGTTAHHLLRRNSAAIHFFTPMNVMPLCPEHHGWAHGMSADVERFQPLLEANHPERVLWMREHANDQPMQIDYQRIAVEIAGRKV